MWRLIRGLNWRILVFLGLFVILFVWFGYPRLHEVIDGHKQASTVPTPVGTVTSPPTVPTRTVPTITSPTTTTGPTSPPPARGGKATSTTTPVAQMAAVNAAAFELDQLYRANFYTKPLLQATVNQYVVPSAKYRPLAVTLSLKAGRKLAKKWGYVSKQEASDESQAREHTFYYKVDSFKPPVARIRLVIYETFREVSPQLRQLVLAGDNSTPYQWDYTIPRIVIVTMYKYDGKWWYCFNQDAPYGSGQPTQEPGLNLNETLARFTPFEQKGFHEYETAP